MNDTVTPPQQDHHEDDTLDIFGALFNAWVALEAIRKTLPDQQAASVGEALEGMAQAMGPLMKRHDIKVSIERCNEKESMSQG